MSIWDNVLTVPCPYCVARKGRPCTTGSRKRAGEPHAARIRKATLAAAKIEKGQR